MTIPTTTVSSFTKLLWFCSGADSLLLERCPRSDQVKYQGLGGVVLATGVLAFVSGSYAFYTVFSPKTTTAIENAAAGIHWPSAFMAVIAGLVWAAIIFNIERFIVSSTGKGDGTDKITAQELLYASPRILMACIFGICLSKPLEIRILKSEIESELVKRQEQYEVELNESNKSKHSDRRTDLLQKVADSQNRIDQIDVDLESRRKEISAQYALLEAEAEGLSGSGKAGRGPAWRDKQANLDRLKRELERDRQSAMSQQTRLQEGHTSAKSALELIDADQTQAQQSNAQKAAHLDGLLQRIEIAHELSPTMSWLLTLLLLMIETGPIFFKMMVSKSAYDYLKENQNKLALAEAGIEHNVRFFLAEDPITASEGTSGYEPGLLGRIWRSIFGGSEHGSDSYQEHETVNFAVQRILEEERRRFETEQILAEEIHAQYRRLKQEEIRRDVGPFLEPELAETLSEVPETRVPYTATIEDLPETEPVSLVEESEPPEEAETREESEGEIEAAPAPEDEEPAPVALDESDSPEEPTPTETRPA